jgi:hypothetical protein
MQTNPTLPAHGPTQNESAGFSPQYPSDWSTIQDKEHVLAIEPAGLNPSDAQQRITVDVPSLPRHFPGMITLGRVKSGFIEGQRKKLTDVNVVEDVDQSVPGATAARVVLTGKLNSQNRKMAALLMMHDGRAYILRADGDLANFRQTKAALDQRVATLRWLN